MDQFESGLDGVQHVDRFDLDEPSEKASYEGIINSYQVLRDEFNYDKKTGRPIITVWYLVPCNDATLI